MKGNVNNKTVASDHGFERILERTSCKRKDINRFVVDVWSSGKTIESYDSKTRMHSYLMNVSQNGGKDRAVRVKGNTVYIFNKIGSVLITCFDVPQKVLQSKNKDKKRRLNYEKRF